MEAVQPLGLLSAFLYFSLVKPGEAFLLRVEPRSSAVGRRGHSPSQPSSSPLPSRSLSHSPFPALPAARVPLIEDSLSCQPLVSRHACES